MKAQHIERLDLIFNTVEASWMDKSVALKILRKLIDRGGMIDDILDELESSCMFCVERPGKAAEYLKATYQIESR